MREGPDRNIKDRQVRARIGHATGLTGSQFIGPDKLLRANNFVSLSSQSTNNLLLNTFQKRNKVMMDKISAIRKGQ